MGLQARKPIDQFETYAEPLTRIPPTWNAGWERVHSSIELTVGGQVPPVSLAHPFVELHKVKLRRRVPYTATGIGDQMVFGSEWPSVWSSDALEVESRPQGGLRMTWSGMLDDAAVNLTARYKKRTTHISRPLDEWSRWLRIRNTSAARYPSRLRDPQELLDGLQLSPTELVRLATLTAAHPVYDLNEHLYLATTRTLDDIEAHYAEGRFSQAAMIAHEAGVEPDAVLPYLQAGLSDVALIRGAVEGSIPVEYALQLAGD